MGKNIYNYRLRRLMKTKLKFVAKTHKYSIGENTLTSVTQFISQFFKEFNENEMAKIMSFVSKKKGIKGQGIRYWKKHWKQMSQHGTRVHQFLEEYITLGEKDTYTEPDTQKILAGISYLALTKEALGKEWEFKPEVKIFNESLGMAGTIDLMIVKNKEVYLVDWKTNKKIEMIGYKGAKAKAPVSHLPDCNYVKYSLQLNLYRHLLEQQGYTIKGMTLVHLLPDSTYVSYDIPVMKKEVEDILNEPKPK
jgi:ATP-dependent exoDNAse (exonuclease V) beta subunit